MIQFLHHIAIIVSSEKSIDFYSKLGSVEKERRVRDYDTVVFMEGGGTLLEIFIDINHPRRTTNPEAIGLRHLAFKVEDLDKIIGAFECDRIMEDWNGVRFAFIKDPDGMPIEIHE